MRTLRLGFSGVILLLAGCVAAAAQPKALELRRAVPADMFMVVHGKHNPERDFQRAYYKEVWKTVRETRIITRVIEIVSSQLSPDEVEKAKSVFNEIKQAAAPIKIDALADSKEIVFAQRMGILSDKVKVPTAQHLMLVRLTPEAAAETHKGIKNLFGLVEKYTEGKVSVKSSTEGDATIVTLAIPGEMPFQPTVVRLGDVLLLSSVEPLARQSLGMLTGGEGPSKFDDPRLKEALGHLPEPEDSLAFFDGKQYFGQLRGLLDFVRSAAANDPKAQRVVGLLEQVLDEVAVFDYDVTVEYTEGNLNRTAAYGKLMPGAESKTLTKVLGSGEPFKNWQAWVPANAVSYGLTTGVNLHPLYERAMEVIKERFPEAKPGLEQFEQIQNQIGVHLDRDILQAFSGESVSLALPKATPSPGAGHDSVWAFRCHKPDRIRELLHLLVDKLGEHPAVAAYQFRLAKCDDLDGFEELSAVLLTTLGVKPVIGFRDGWMIVGSNAEAVKQMLQARSGKGESIAQTKAFKQFQLKVEGPVQAIRYTNTAENIRQAAAIINQVGTMAPMILATAAGKAKPEQLKVVQDLLGLLPSVGQIVSKFDFLEAKMSVTQAGDQPGTYIRRTVTVVRPASPR
jgi:hypothetical protein